MDRLVPTGGGQGLADPSTSNVALLGWPDLLAGAWGRNENKKQNHPPDPGRNRPRILPRDHPGGKRAQDQNKNRLKHDKVIFMFCCICADAIPRCPHMNLRFGLRGCFLCNLLYFSTKLGPKTPLNGSGSKNGVEPTKYQPRMRIRMPICDHVLFEHQN